MKNIILLTILIVSQIASAQQGNLRAVAEKGKSTLIQMSESEILKNQDLSAKELSESNLSSHIEERLVTFEDYLNYQGGDINEISKSEDKYHFALYKESVISTVTIGVDKENQLTPIEFNNQFLTQELSQMPDGEIQGGFKGYKLLRIPNMNAYVYVSPDGDAFTSHNGRNLNERYQVEDLLRELKEEAVIFQQEFGDEVKKGKLVD